MNSPFCDTCGTIITTKREGANGELIFWCSTCQKEVRSKIDTTMFQERTTIEHKPSDFTRVLENEPPPVPKIFTQSYSQRKKKRCNHPNAVFQGFYQFSRGDESSRKYWFCPSCGQVFRYSGRMNAKLKRKIIDEKQTNNQDEDSVD